MSDRMPLWMSEHWLLDAFQVFVHVAAQNLFDLVIVERRSQATCQAFSASVLRVLVAFAIA